MAFELKGTPSGETWTATDAFDTQDIGHLEKKDGEDYKILLLSDIQLLGNPLEDTKALALVDELVKEVNPDFIMTTGDNSYLLLADITTKKFIKQMETYEIPWGVTFGNHDSEGRADRVWHGNQYEDAAYSMYKMGPDNVQGIGNYVINIDDESGTPVYSMIMMDSNVNRKYDTGKDYDYIYPNQISWYEWAVNGQPDVPSMLVFHIPLPEFEDAVTQWNDGTIDSSLGFGETREDVFCPPENTGLFDKVKALGSTSHIFVGHDHVNNLSVEYEGVRLTYGLKTGPASYSDDDLQGATLITIVDGTNEVVVEHVYR